MNARSLATGHCNLTVLLQEPGDGEHMSDYTESLPSTVRFIGDQLREVSE